ncbi:nucleoprotein TPR [Toxorhynchites rutilus septentrionalis]|uniref:nucleoprotein TPR n=1 Tax=Toxorhynchites rutilus septentrionalis TaxID=329112 RepID=UPI002479F91A|nr:nucleoprotein TPR [Toxorhynchites rutilus septentrionalis]XP_055626525.1 nucleoprotein TPR [Toxorhynchites rutilus septentrionalis]XP_055626526.1 nucleoprotein TPR [Toxorhynchites rutilus septentrionalis]XP_055626528.1 nucleoprotein TPR [Toxorhynchites rutilus septentrionalis]XP_055626529.1 nucleoprotein TPR [Toxorhynchites rutilus septentrionalis]
MRRSCSRLATMTQRITPPLVQFITLTVCFCLSAVQCVPMKYEIGYRNSIDLDAEQTEARYDQGMLSDIMNDDRVEMQKAESCMADNFKYDHGQKIQRYDPCEICLCIDGEIFCWWKQCDAPSSFELSGGSPLGASKFQSITSTAKTSSPVDTTQPQPQPASAVTASPPSTSSATTTLPKETSEVATSTARPKSPALALPPYPDQSDSSVRILHPQPLENIPQNILSFPQSPPIMMYRPPMVGKNSTTSSVSVATAAAAERNKHSGPLKKAIPLHLNNGGVKKPYRKSKSKGYTINFSHINDRVAPNEGPRMQVVTEGNPAADGGHIDDGVAHSFGGVRSGISRFPIAVSDGADGDDDDDDDDVDDDEDDEDDDDDDEDSAETEGQSKNNGVSRSQSGSGANNDGKFGGYGYGMFKEAEEDKQQHYIITSSGHVEMFDDTSMEVTENAFGMNRLPSQPDQQQQQQLTTVTNATDIPAVVAQGDSSLEHHDQQATSSTSSAESGSDPMPPLITMITNVTRNSIYSNRLSDSASGGAATNPPLTPYAPLSSGSIIDVLNSTAVDGGDYLDDNQTELIYPAVPGLSDNGGGSSGTQMKTTGATMTTQSSATVGAKSIPQQHCVVMGVSYKVGSVLKQETGNCLHCVCVAGPENDPVPRVTCTPLNCPPLILPDILDGAGF